jgi:lipid-binding SYLF domain-containing protein
MGWARCHLQQAQAIIIFPSVLKGAFLIGGEGGSGVALARDKTTGEWSYPAFYTMGSVSFGLQIGGKVSEVLLMVMTQKGLDALLTTSFKLGGDVGIAAGPVGTGVQGKLTDFLSFVNSKGAFAGLSLDGAVIAPRNEWNSAYYGKPVTPSDIFIRRVVKNPHADALRVQVGRIK